MKCSVQQNVLVREFDYLRKAGAEAITISVPPEMPYTITLVASSARCWMESKLANLDIAGRESGTFALATSKIEEVARTLKADLDFATDGRALVMSWPEGHCRVMAPWTINQPMFAISAVLSKVQLEPQVFLSLLAKLKFCNPPPSEARIPGLKFDVAGMVLSVTSTNGIALGIIEHDMERETPAGSFVLPVAVCDDIAALLRENRSEPLVLHFMAGHLEVICGHRTYVTTYAAKTFPNVSRFFEQPMPKQAEFESSVAMRALRRAQAASDYDHNVSARVRFGIGPNEITLETLESREVIGLYDSEPTSLVVNSRMLNGVLDALAAPSVIMRGASAASPWLFMPKDNSSRARFILAPMSAL